MIQFMPANHSITNVLSPKYRLPKQQPQIDKNETCVPGCEPLLLIVFDKSKYLDNIRICRYTSNGQHREFNPNKNAVFF